MGGVPMTDDEQADFTNRAAGLETPNFGALLRHFRENYSERIGRKRGAPVFRMRLTALALIDCLKDKGYAISSGAYSLIESGESLPKDARRFLSAATQCLELSPEEAEQLTDQLGYDVVRSRLGEDVAKRAFPETARTLRG
jgi:hypothetical protein